MVRQARDLFWLGSEWSELKDLLKLHAGLKVKTRVSREAGRSASMTDRPAPASLKEADVEKGFRTTTAAPTSTSSALEGEGRRGGFASTAFDCA